MSLLADTVSTSMHGAALTALQPGRQTICAKVSQNNGVIATVRRTAMEAAQAAQARDHRALDELLQTYHT